MHLSETDTPGSDALSPPKPGDAPALGRGIAVVLVFPRNGGMEGGCFCF